jgi:hypothetical protein
MTKTPMLQRGTYLHQGGHPLMGGPVQFRPCSPLSKQNMGVQTFSFSLGRKLNKARINLKYD